VEGSLAVVLASAATVVACFGLWGSASLTFLLIAAAVVGLAIGVVEAVSPHGLDNLTIPVSSALLLRGLRAVEWL
jgi:dolichol kinase